METPVSKPRRNKAIKQFVVELNGEAPTVTQRFGEVSAEVQVQSLSKKLKRYRRRYARVLATAETLHTDNHELTEYAAQLERQLRQLAAEYAQLKEEVDAKASHPADSTSHSAGRLQELALENMQEKLFVQNDVIRELNLNLAKTQARAESLEEELRKAKIELEALKAKS